LDSEAAKTSEIRLFKVINHEKRKEKHAADQFFRSLLASRMKPSLTLVTCYPFYFVGPAPSRYIVEASLKQ
jgi:sortase (surface protein transpeptidase)